jgi:hypothetical protein
MKGTSKRRLVNDLKAALKAPIPRTAESRPDLAGDRQAWAESQWWTRKITPSR